MRFPLDKYKYFTYKNEKDGTSVVAVSSYAGKTVRAVANCDPIDNFNLEKGKILAAARCNEKIANKRLMRAEKKYIESLKAADAAIEYYNRMRQYFMDSVDLLDEAKSELEELIKYY